MIRHRLLVRGKKVHMIKTKLKIYRNTVILLAILIISIITLLKMLQLLPGDAARLPDSVSHAHAGDGAGIDYAATAAASNEIPDGPQVKYSSISNIPAASSTGSFMDDIVSLADDNSGPDDGVFSDKGLRLLFATGYDFRNNNSIGGIDPDAYEKFVNLSNNDSGKDAAGADLAGITLADYYAARVALFPIGALSMFNTELIYDAPYNNPNLFNYTTFITSAVIDAFQVLEDNSDILETLSARADRPRKNVYLTIDDGPSKLTGKFLDILNAKGVRATFFVVGNNVRKYPGLIRDMYDAGHCIANHSNTHNYDKLYQSFSSLSSEIEKCEQAINDALGFEYNTGIFRFPGGSAYKTASKYRNDIKKIGYTYYDWNCLNGDAQIKDKSANSLYNYMLSTFKGQNEVILLMHDSDTKQTTLDMLDRAIDFFLEKDYVFKTLDEK